MTVGNNAQSSGETVVQHPEKGKSSEKNRSVPSDKGNQNIKLDANTTARNLRESVPEVYRKVDNNSSISAGDRTNEIRSRSAYCCVVHQANLIYPYSAVSFSNMGRAYSHTNQLDKAVEALKKAIQLEPTFTDSYGNLGDTFISKRRTISLPNLLVSGACK